MTILDGETWEVERTLACPGNAICSIGFLGKGILVVFADETAGFLDPNTGKCTIGSFGKKWHWPRAYASTVAASRFEYDADFAVGETSGRIRFDTATDYGVTKVGVRILDGAHDGAVAALLRVPETDLLVSGGEDGAVRLWSLKDLKRVSELPRPAAAVTDLALSQDLRTLWVARKDGSVVGYDFPGFRDGGLDR